VRAAFRTEIPRGRIFGSYLLIDIDAQARLVVRIANAVADFRTARKKLLQLFVESTPLADSEIVDGQVQMQVDGMTYRRNIRRSVPSRLDAEKFARVRNLARQVEPTGRGDVHADEVNIAVGNERQMRVSIFLNVFDVHVNRCPIAGVVRDVHYQHGMYLNAMNSSSAEKNEQNIVTVVGDGQTVVFKQIAGLLARRIVFYPKVGDRLDRGQRVGLIKFGSRVDVLLDGSARMNVKIGDRVKGGASILAYLQPHGALAAAGSAAAAQRTN